MNRKNYDLVDVSKLLLAIFVVSIHAGVPVAGWLGRLAVPYFFIISGYFYFKKYNLLNDRTLKIKSFISYSKRIAMLLAVWDVMYLPLITYKIYASGNFSITKTGVQLLLGQLPGFGVAWYLSASILGLGILLLMINFWGTKVTFTIALFMEVFFIILCGYHSFTMQWTEMLDFGLMNNLVFTFLRSWFYLILGYWLSTHIDEIKSNFSNFVIPGLGVLLLEHFVINKYGTWYGGPGTDETLFVPIVAFCVAVFTLKSNIKIKNATMLRELSTFIFLAHLGALGVPKLISKIFWDVNVTWVNWIVATALLVVIYLVLSKNRKIIKLLI